jgi:hypothetical protein
MSDIKILGRHGKPLVYRYANWHWATYQYDERGFLIKKEEFNHWTKYHRDDDGSELKVVHSSGWIRYMHNGRCKRDYFSKLISRQSDIDYPFNVKEHSSEEFRAEWERQYAAAMERAIAWDREQFQLENKSIQPTKPDNQCIIPTT